MDREPNIKPISAAELLNVDDVVSMTKLPESEVIEAMRQGRLGFDVAEGEFVVTAMDLFDWLARHDRAAFAFRRPALKPYNLIAPVDEVDGLPKEPARVEDDH